MKRFELFFTFILLPVDIAMIIASFVMAYYLRLDLHIGEEFSHIGVSEYLRYALYLIPIWILINALNGLYETKPQKGLFNRLYKVFISNSVAMLFLIMGIFFTKTAFFSRLILIFIWVISVVLIFLGRVIIKMIQLNLLKKGIGRRRLIILGSDIIAEFVVGEIRKNKEIGYEILGIINGSKESESNLKRLGKFADSLNILKKTRPDEVILTDSSIDKKILNKIIEYCSNTNITFKFIPDIMSFTTLKVSQGSIGSMPVFSVVHLSLDGWRRILKRIFDFIFALVAIIITSPIQLIIILLQLLTTGSPILYKQKRVGRDNAVFELYKFRSMYVDKCDFSPKGTKWTTKKDDETRVTPLGRFLRKSNFDELPQFFNILKGDMSVVGPRPELPKFVEEFNQKYPDYFKRHRVKSGLTGWAQVNGLKGDTSIAERVRYDMFYIENWSFWFDLKIILKTFWLVIYEICGGKYEYRTGS